MTPESRDRHDRDRHGAAVATATAVYTVSDEDCAAAPAMVVEAGGREYVTTCPPSEVWAYLAPYLRVDGTMPGQVWRHLAFQDGATDGMEGFDAFCGTCDMVQAGSRFLAAALDHEGVHAVRMQLEAGTWTAHDVMVNVRAAVGLWWDHVTVSPDLG
jgi:hypothetical protein